MRQARHVLIDCDPGIDDALGLILALASDELKVEAVITVFGNVDVNQTTQNALKVLSICGRDELPPVGRGCASSLRGRLRVLRDAHGKDGLGNCSLPTPSITLTSEDGIELLKTCLLKGKVDTIIATGPLTNIARVLLQEPQAAKRIRNLVVMGGAFHLPGNFAREAEFNFYSDPEAAQVVLNSQAVVTLVSLDLTRKVILKDEDLEGLRRIAASSSQRAKSDLANFIVCVAEFDIDFHRKKRGVEGAFMHDPLAVGIAIDESLGQFEKLHIEVDTGKQRGRISIGDGVPNVRFCKEVDEKRFLKMFLERLEEFCERP